MSAWMPVVANLVTNVMLGWGAGIIGAAALKALVKPRRKRALTPVNVFSGVVFPDPRDPRWRPVNGPGADQRPCFRFGDRDIVLMPGRLEVSGFEISTGVDAVEYYEATARAYDDFHRELALQSVMPAILGAGFAPDEKPREAPLATALARTCEVDHGLPVVGGLPVPRPTSSRWALDDVRGRWIWGYAGVTIDVGPGQVVVSEGNRRVVLVSGFSAAAYFCEIDAAHGHLLTSKS